jgi:hypothetical protein
LLHVVLSDFCPAKKKDSRMFDKLKQKWKVSAFQLALILCVFAVGGSLTGWVSKKIMNLLSIEADWLWAIIYILLVTIIWPLMVLLVSVPFGQFRFFTNYTRKLGQKMGIIKSDR